jgi:uncharacterized protein (TIGR02466 family)
MINLFSTPIYKKKIILDDEKIKNFCYKLQNEKYYRKESNVGGFQSDNILNYKEIDNELFIFMEEIKKHIDVFYKYLELDSNYKQSISQIWCNINSHKDLNLKHCHLKSIFSGVYFVETPDDCGPLKFHHPSPVFEHTWNLERKMWNEINCTSYNFIPEKGDLYIFPSWSEHSVEMNRSNKDRISLAFDTV